MDNKIFEKFKEKLLEIDNIMATLCLLDWDTNVNMPPKGAELRGKAAATLSALIHDKLLDKEFEMLLLKLKEQMDRKALTSEQSAIVREEYRVFTREKKLPTSFVKELAALTSEAHTVWAKARKASDFKMFAPYLSRIVELKRRQAKLIGYRVSPYDALLEDFEPGLTSEEVSIIFDELKNFLVPLIKKIGKTKINYDTGRIKGNFSLDKQKAFNRLVAEKIGYDFEAGRMDESTHPFSQSFGPGDARITTRYSEDDVLYSLGSTIHEVGHALYEQGLKPEHFGTPLGNSISLGIHESQSRVWENLVGNSRPFWKFFYPQLQKYFPQPFKKLKPEDFYRVINRVQPSLIRVDSDEVTYNLHIIIRFEIEKELIEGSVEVKDLPKIWNAKYKEYLGVKVPNDAQGVLQDVHWSGGMFGYFPTYTLGNLYSAQFYNQAKSEIMNMEELFEKGQYRPFLEWLRKNIHQHGKLYTAAELCQKITGEALNNKHYFNYLTEKFSDLYGI